MRYTADFERLVGAFAGHETAYAAIYPASIAQFILESARGSSELAREHRNFAGMKWRPEMSGVAEMVLVEAPSETDYFCHFDDIGDFVRGYWMFLGRAPYAGWKEHAADPFDFIDFIAPRWAADAAYADKLKGLIAEAESLIGTFGPDAGDAPCCGGMAGEGAAGIRWRKPQVRWDPSPFNWSREGTPIDTIVMHYTTSRNLDGTVNWFKSPDNTHRTAAHYVIGRDGTIVQMVADGDACTHGNSQNRRSIGIEHSAAAGDAMTESQERSSVAIVRWLMQQYGIRPDRVIGHKCAPRSTNCPGDLFRNYGATADSDCVQVTGAVQRWVRERVMRAEDLVA